MAIEQFVYTNRETDRGVYENLVGFQLAACSPGLSENLRNLLVHEICPEFRELLYEKGPRVAKDREAQWGRSGDIDQSTVPEAVLEHFPIIWRYMPLAENLWGLLRAAYLGYIPGNDGRPGNFMVHGLVFEPHALGVCGHNPLILRHTELFRRRDDGKTTELSALHDLSVSSGVLADSDLLLKEPYRKQAAAMLSTIRDIRATGTTSLVVCLRNWHDAVLLVESLLNLMPPQERCHTSFCTYMTEPEKKRQEERDNIIVVCAENVEELQLRPDAYSLQSERGPGPFVVFNFAKDMYFQIDSLRPYAVFANDCVSNGRREHLTEYHLLGEKLGVAHDVGVWDVLVPCAGLLTQRANATVICEAIRVLKDVATEARQARVVLDVAVPHVRSLVDADNVDAVAELSSSLAVLVDRALQGQDADASPKLVKEVFDMAREAFNRGSARMASTLPRAVGSQQSSAVRWMLKGAKIDQAGKPPETPGGSKEAWAMAELLLEGLNLADQGHNQAPPPERLMAASLVAAARARQASDVWNAIGNKHIKPFFEGPGGLQEITLLQAIAASLSEDTCLEAKLWAELRLLQLSPPKGETLHARFGDIAALIARLPDGQEKALQAMKILNSLIPSGVQRTVVLARMAEVGWQNTTARDVFFSEYYKSLRQASEQREETRKAVAEIQAIKVLTNDFFTELLPWKRSASIERLKSWRTMILTDYPEVLESIRLSMARRLESSQRPREDYPLVVRLFRIGSEPQAESPGLVALFSAYVLSRPIARVSDETMQLLVKPPCKIVGESQAYLSVLTLISEVDKAAAQEGWKPSQFPYGDASWRGVRSLSSQRRKNVIRWCLRLFGQTGITTVEEGRAFHRVLRVTGLGDKDKMAEAIKQWSSDRDVVTVVQAITAFALLAAGESVEGTYWRGLFELLIKDCDEQTRALLVDHLQHRCRRSSSRSDRRMASICEDAGLSVPDLAPPAAVSDEDQEAVDPTPESRGRVWSSLKRVLSFGKGSAAEKPVPTAQSSRDSPDNKESPEESGKTAERPKKGPPDKR